MGSAPCVNIEIPVSKDESLVMVNALLDHPLIKNAKVEDSCIEGVFVYRKVEFYFMWTDCYKESLGNSGKPALVIQYNQGYDESVCRFSQGTDMIYDLYQSLRDFSVDMVCYVGTFWI